MTSLVSHLTLDAIRSGTSLGTGIDAVAAILVVIVLIERELPEAWAGRKLAGLTESDRFRVVSVSRGGEARLAGAELVGQEGDLLHLAVRKDALDELEARLGDPTAVGHP